MSQKKRKKIFKFLHICKACFSETTVPLWAQKDFFKPHNFLFRLWVPVMDNAQTGT